MKQTVVDWLAEKYNYVTWLRNRDEKLAGRADKMMEHYLVEAKEMEKTNTDNKVIHFAEWITKKHTTVLMTLYEQFEEQYYNENTNKMVNIEFNPLNGSSFMNDLRNEYMKKQTAVEWLQKKLIESGISFLSEEIEYINQAKEMEKEQIIEAWMATDNPLQRMSAEQYYNETYNTETK